MTERIVIESGQITIPVGIQAKNDPKKTIDFDLKFDISDETLRNANERQKEMNTKLTALKKQYQDIIDHEITDENMSKAVEAANASLRVMFDSDFGEGMYDKIANAGGGNSFVNMIELYNRVNDFITAKINTKVQKITQRSKQRKAKYLKKRRKK